MSNNSALKFLIVTCLSATMGAAQSHAPRKSISAIAKVGSGAVVSIVMSDKDGNPVVQGSGFFVSKGGLVVTNYHVISEGNSAVIKLPDGTSYAMDGVLTYNKVRDIAVVKADGENFRSLKLGDSDQIEVGQEVVAIGNPLSLESTVSDGIISGIRSNEKLGGEFLQITAPISPGSSGGPLFAMDGSVIGITSGYLKTGENLNFAIPINDAKSLLFESEGPQAAANLKGIYMCDTEVVPMHLALKVSGRSMVLTIHTSSGGAGEISLHQDGHIWIANEESQRAADPHKFREPVPTFAVANNMSFFLANTFVYDRSNSQIVAGAETDAYPEYLTLSGTCKSNPQP